jgi:hypothetical protein
MFFAYLIGVFAAFALENLWYRTTPEKNSGWILFAVVVFTVILDGGSGGLAGFVVHLILGAGFGWLWYEARSKPRSGWLLFCSIWSALGLLSCLTNI